ncbi:splicing regulator RBM11 isoform X3 [Cyanistes caeruleus]|uniref:splicing regulator RBM11 isoform X3 n=1 Tax=Cyanistes caeruleus TaxID=156563 RepID=UPI000CDA8379|nr:splicing regulator RBM11 isoform X3 [Cyanistes caeruleus]
MLGVVSPTDATPARPRSSVARSRARPLTPCPGAQLPRSWDALLALPQVPAGSRRFPQVPAGSRRLYVVAGAVRGGGADSARGELGEPGQGRDPLRALPAGRRRAGPLTKVMICEDKEGKPKSFGYVCFKHKVSVPYAKALLDGIHLYGRPITVQYWRGSSHSPELDSCTDGFEHHIDLDSSADRHQELSGNSPFPVTPLLVNNSLLHDHPGFQEVNKTAQFKTAQSSPELATSK